MFCKRINSACKKVVVGTSLFVGVAFTSTPSWGYALVGNGWDGPGWGHTALTYHFGALTSDLPGTIVEATLEAALGVWAAAADLTFVETASAGLPMSIDFAFETGAHGDGFAFDGPGGVLAHTFSPSPPHPEPIAGDVHFDDDELWEVGNGFGAAAFDLTWVAVHEIGHALGLGHSTVPGSVMSSSVSAHSVFTGLHTDDIGGILSLYAPAPLTHTPEPGSLALLGTGLFGLLGYGWQRRQRAA